MPGYFAATQELREQISVTLRFLRVDFSRHPINVVTHFDHDQFSTSAFAILNWPDKARGRA